MQRRTRNALRDTGDYRIGGRYPLPPATANLVMLELFPAVKGTPDHKRGRRFNNPGAWSFWLTDGRRVDYCHTNAKGGLTVAATVTPDPDRPAPLEDMP